MPAFKKRTKLLFFSGMKPKTKLKHVIADNGKDKKREGAFLAPPVVCKY